MGNGHGGHRPGAGRKPGATSKAKRDLMEAAKEHGPAALQTLVDIQGDDDAPHSARLSAAVAILDRAYGKPSQSVQHSGGIATSEMTKEQRDAVVAAALGADE